jgi:peptidoglycan/LPS O-acetylase OafA/YrhL
MDSAGPHAYRPHLPGVESLRGYAAFAIVIFHVIHITQAPIPRALEFMKWFFGFGVPLFFVLSAFSLAYGYDGKLSRTDQVAEFYLRRLLRIAPLYYLAILAQMSAIAALGYDQPHWTMVALCFGFLFNLHPPSVDGIAAASWSIGIEMLFYAAFPFLLALAKTLPRALLFTAASAAVAVAFAVVATDLKLNPAFVVHGLLFNLPYFAFGLIAYQLYRVTPARLGGSLVIVGLALIAGVWALAKFYGPAFAELIPNTLYQASWGVPFGVLCLGMALRPPLLMSNPITQFLGKISFGVYLAHPHVISILMKLGVYERILNAPGGSGVTFPLAVLATCAVVIPLAWLLFEYVEAPGIQLGRRLADRFGLGRANQTEVSATA